MSRPKTAEECAIWNAGREHAERRIAYDMFKQAFFNHREFLLTLMSSAGKLEGDLWKGYAEGLRHAINILGPGGSPQENYATIINRSVPEIEVKDGYGRVFYSVDPDKKPIIL